MFCTFLNVSKALDSINYVKLFELLAHGMLPPVSVWFQLNMYTSRIFRVSWNGVCSIPLPVLNGVKQCGVISLVLFCIYLDELLGEMADAGVGCYTWNVFVLPFCTLRRYCVTSSCG